MLENHNKKKVLVKINVRYKPDLHSEYKICSVEFMSEKSFAKLYKIWYNDYRVGYSADIVES